MTLALETPATPDDLLASKSDGRFELIDGRLVEKPLMSKESNEIAGEAILALKLYCRSRPIARVYPEQPFMCFGNTDDPHRVRKPDVAVVLTGRVAADAGDPSFFNIAPDIAIEVLSPNDRIVDIDEKLADYESAGVPLIWHLNPARREVEVRTAAGDVSVLRASDTLTAEPILPGFSVKVADLFPPEPAATA